MIQIIYRHILVLKSNQVQVYLLSDKDTCSASNSITFVNCLSVKAINLSLPVIGATCKWVQ